MAGAKGKEAIVEGHEEIGEERGEELKKKKIDRLRGMLEGDLARLRNKDVEDVIRYLDVDEIISLALKSRQANEKVFDEYGYLEGGSFVPSHGKVLRLLKLMLQSGVEKLKEVDLYILYQNFLKLPFAQLLLSALDSCFLFDKADENVLISKLCCILPWKIFIHIMYHKTKLLQFKRIEDESNSECTIQKKAAGSCEICCGKGKHSGVYGYFCSFWDSVPSGLTVGPSHYVCCRNCLFPAGAEANGSVWCVCGSRMMGRAVPCSKRWRF